MATGKKLFENCREVQGYSEYSSALSGKVNKIPDYAGGGTTIDLAYKMLRHDPNQRPSATEIHMGIFSEANRNTGEVQESPHHCNETQNDRPSSQVIADIFITTPNESDHWRASAELDPVPTESPILLPSETEESKEISVVNHIHVLNPPNEWRQLITEHNDQLPAATGTDIRDLPPTEKKLKWWKKLRRMVR